MLSKKPHVIHIVKTLDRGGIESLVLGLSTTPSLKAFQHSVLCLFGTQGRLQKNYREAGIPIYICPARWPLDKTLFPYRVSKALRRVAGSSLPYRLARQVKGLKADLVHTHVESRIDEQAIGILRGAGFPWIWTIHGRYQPQGKQLNSWRKAVRHIGEYGTSCITADSKALSKDLINCIPEAAEFVSVIHPGADVALFSNDKIRDLSWRQKTGIPNEVILFGSSGRLTYEKGPDIFIKAAARLIEQGLDAHFALSGEGYLSQSLLDEITGSCLENRIHLLGFQEDLPYIHDQFDVFVLASRTEGFPLALIEALASGLPCIATDVGGVSEMLGKDGGLVVPPEAPGDLADAMRQLFDPQARLKLASSAPKIARKYSFDVSAKGFAEIYEKLIGID